MKLGKLRVGVTDILLLALNASFFIGIQTVFSPCEPRPARNLLEESGIIAISIDDNEVNVAE